MEPSIHTRIANLRTCTKSAVSTKHQNTRERAPRYCEAAWREPKTRTYKHAARGRGIRGHYKKQSRCKIIGRSRPQPRVMKNRARARKRMTFYTRAAHGRVLLAAPTRTERARDEIFAGIVHGGGAPSSIRRRSRTRRINKKKNNTR